MIRMLVTEDRTMSLLDLAPAPLPHPRETIAERRPSNGLRAVLVAAGLAIVIAVFVARCARIARADAITSDESTYLVHAIHYWMTGDDLVMWELGSPRLPHLLNGWASFQAVKAGGLLPASAPREAAVTQLVNSGANRVLLPARAMAIASAVLLLLAVFWGVARTRGGGQALIAVGLLSLVPDLLAHASIAGSDVPFAAAATLALVLLVRYAERPSPGRWVAVALAVGLAWAMRHAALLLLLLGLVVHLACAVKRERPRGPRSILECLLGSAAACVGMGILAYLVLWAGDGFGAIPLGDLSARVTALSVPARLGPFDLAPFPLPTSALSILKQVRHQSQGHEAYLCGAFSQKGWPLYFPLAFLFKTPIGFLGLMVIAAARVRPRGSSEAILLACLALLWVMLVRNKVNIGVRYALLTYPLVAPFLARLFEPAMLRDRVWGPLTVAFTVWLAVASLGSGRHCLSYFNEIGGGPRSGWLYLADSNLDWGQDVNVLGRELTRLGIKDVTTDLSSERLLVVPGVFVVPNPSKEYQVPAVTPRNRRLYDSDGGYLPVYTRYVAASVSRLLGLYSQNDMSWLRTRKVVVRVGDSIFVFDMDTPADRPFGE
jgi:4-amino-4-deoxy-L-arabinose transferase-like glycosyltransferase